MTDVLRILGAVALVALNAFFVATEFAVTRIRLGQVVELEKAGRPGARAARHAVEHIDAYLAACQLGITVASIGLGALAEPAFAQLLEPLVGSFAPGVAVGVSLVLAFVIVTLLHVVLGELAPKSLAIARTARIVLFVSPPMRVFYLATKPLVDLFNWLGNLVLKPFGVPPAREVGHAPHSEDELRMLLAQSLGEGLIDAYEREYAENALIFGDLRARQVMVPRRDIDFLVLGESVPQAVERASASLHTRLPLCTSPDALDDPVGVVNFKELLRLGMTGAETGLERLARPLARVSESMLVDEVLRELRQKRQHMALVVDEYGTTVGLMTLEDIVEEIVGEFEDEEEEEDETAHDTDIRREGDDLLVPGAALLGDVEDALGVEIGNTGSATIGGHLIELLGRVPEAGEVVEVEGFPARVLAVDEARVEALSISAPREEGREAP